jgi:hypothetical protein
MIPRTCWSRCDDRLWHPAARLFRQTAWRDYAEVLDRIRTELKALISAR